MSQLNASPSSKYTAYLVTRHYVEEGSLHELFCNHHSSDDIYGSRIFCESTIEKFIQTNASSIRAYPWEAPDSISVLENGNDCLIELLVSGGSESELCVFINCALLISENHDLHEKSVFIRDNLAFRFEKFYEVNLDLDPYDILSQAHERLLKHIQTAPHLIEGAVLSSDYQRNIDKFHFEEGYFSSIMVSFERSEEGMIVRIPSTNELVLSCPEDFLGYATLLPSFAELFSEDLKVSIEIDDDREFALFKLKDNLWITNFRNPSDQSQFYWNQEEKLKDIQDNITTPQGVIQCLESLNITHALYNAFVDYDDGRYAYLSFSCFIGTQKVLEFDLIPFDKSLFEEWIEQIQAINSSVRFKLARDLEFHWKTELMAYDHEFYSPEHPEENL